MRPEAADVLIVGGGLVGATAALTIAGAGLSVTVVERQRPRLRTGRLGMDLRTVALAPATQAMLAELDLWPELTAAPYRCMRVWEERGAGEIRFEAAEVGRSELGWIAQVNEATTALWRRLEETPGVTCLAGESVEHLAPGAECVTVTLGGNTLRTRLVIAADGARSVVRSQLGVGVTELATDQIAMATVARTATPHEGIACQCFLLDGPLALLPGADARTVSVVWSQGADNARRREELDGKAFRSELASASGFCFGEVLDTDSRVSFPVSQFVCQALNPHPRVLLIGDAARVIHPLAGLGVNLGFEDVAGIGKALRRAPGKDPGAAGRWRSFARRRKARGIAMMGFLAGLRAFYGMRQPLPNWIRNTGVRLVHGNRTVKRQLVKEALGFGPIATGMR